MKRATSAFSLVEVTLALGVISFALVAVIGLLPAGLRSVKNANEQAGAASVLNVISAAVQNATQDPNNPSQYQIVIPFATAQNPMIVFEIASSPGTSGGTYEWKDLTLEGTENPAFKRLSAILDIHELPTRTNPGRATVSVAWSAAANPQWDSGNQKWTKAEGSLTSPILFLPR